MKFVDEALINVRSGKGGDGCVSFRREKFVPRGGPDGGDGGRGGDVVFHTTSRKRTLYQFRFKRQFNAGNGQNGSGKQKTGKNGQDCVIEIPPGTVIYNAETGELIRDLDQKDQKLVIASGGRGGVGNKHFASSTNRSPRFAQPGEEGQSLSLRLELKFLADVGIIGLPNAGKSTLIRKLSSANAKVGAYPFTTLVPSLGVVYHDWGDPFVVADIPGLIEGAHKGAGLGIRFLRHIERTRVLIHLIDAIEIDDSNPLDGYETVNRELELYDPGLAQKKQIVVLNKSDVAGFAERADMFQKALPDKKVISICAERGNNIQELISETVKALDNVHGR